MAYEVARVHGLILSHIQDGEKDAFSQTWSPPNGKYELPRLSSDTLFPYDFPAELNQWSESSHCSSSLESSTETETESDEDEDFIAGLAEQIAHSMLEDDEHGAGSGLDVDSGIASADDSRLSSPSNAVFPKVVSPQSSWSIDSLSASWSDSVSSSKQSSQVSSPPSTPSTLDSDAWDLLNAAAGEVVRLKVNDDRTTHSTTSQSLKCPTEVSQESAKQYVRPPQPASVWRAQHHQSPTPASNPTSRLNGAISSPKDRVAAHNGPAAQRWTRPREEDRKGFSNAQAQHRLPRNDGAGWNQRQNKPGNIHKGGANQKYGRQNVSYGSHPRVAGKSLDYNAGPQRFGGQGVNVGSGMRAVFLGSAGSGRESGGTGVFLPRCIGGGSDNRRKPACSTVLLPSRIVQVLNLNVEDMRTHPSLPAGASHYRPELSGALRTPPPHMYMMELTGASNLKFEGGDCPSFPRKSPATHIRQSEPIEYSLPTEWTY